jgi:hypothetical protein
MHTLQNITIPESAVGYASFLGLLWLFYYTSDNTIWIVNHITTIFKHIKSHEDRLDELDQKVEMALRMAAAGTESAPPTEAS